MLKVWLKGWKQNMKAFKTAALGIIYSVGSILFAVAAVLAAIFGYFCIQLLLVGREDYLLFVSGKSSVIPLFMIMILIVYGAFKAHEKLSKNKKKISEMIEMSEQDQETIDLESLKK